MDSSSAALGHEKWTTRVYTLIIGDKQSKTIHTLFQVHEFHEWLPAYRMENKLSKSSRCNPTNLNVAQCPNRNLNHEICVLGPK